MTRVAIVEDHLLLAEILRASLAARGIDATVVEPGPVEELAPRLIALAPDLVLLDLDLGGFGDSTPVIGRLTRARIRTLVVTGTSDRNRVALALHAGAFAYCAKSVAFEELTSKIDATLTSAVPLDAELRRELRADLERHNQARKRFDALTERERDTLVALSRGLSVRDIAQQWFVSEATVRTHVRGLLTKLDVPSQLAAVAAALEANWLAQAS
jgi:DNA-binding NarL/FixJ family response regulator